MQTETRRWVELAALQLAALVVAAHLYWGVGRFVERLQYGVFIDPRPLLFVLSSTAIIAGVVYVALGGRRTPVYALGIALMVTYLLGYWAWHLVGHVPAMPWVESQPHPHPGWGPVETLFYHLAADPLALFSKVAELLLLGVLGVLLYDERRGEAGGSDARVGAGAGEAGGESTGGSAGEPAGEAAGEIGAESAGDSAAPEHHSGGDPE